MTAEATATFTAREFNRDVSAAKRAAADGPVIVTDRGRPFVLYFFIGNRPISFFSAIARNCPAFSITIGVIINVVKIPIPTAKIGRASCRERV